MNVATIAVKALKENGKMVDVVESEEINACTVDFKANIDGEEQDLGSAVQERDAQSP